MMIASIARPPQRAVLHHATRRCMSVANTAKAKPESNFSRNSGIAFFSVIVAGTATLGVWQTKRHFWKLGVIEERQKQLHQTIVDLPDYATAYSELNLPEFCQLRVSGHFKPGSTFYLYPRSAPSDASDNVATPKSGGYIYSLLERANGSPVIVNRGWLPRKLLDVHIAQEKKENDDEVTIVGVMRRGEEKGAFTPDNDLARRQFFYLNHDQLADAMEVDESILPVILDATAEENDSEPASLDHFQRKKLSSYLEFYMTPEKHMGYAATWYSFSVAAALMAFFRFRKATIKPRAPVRQPRT